MCSDRRRGFVCVLGWSLVVRGRAVLVGEGLCCYGEGLVDCFACSKKQVLYFDSTVQCTYVCTCVHDAPVHACVQDALYMCAGCPVHVCRMPCTCVQDALYMCAGCPCTGVYRMPCTCVQDASVHVCTCVQDALYMCAGCPCTYSTYVRTSSGVP